MDAGAIGAALGELLTWGTLMWLLLGGALGAIVGILPGLGSTAGLALTLPFVIQMTPFDALAFLMAMIAVGSLASDYTSILFGIPGDGTSAALIPDGLPLTKSGQAGRALGADTIASFIGAIVGAVALAISLPLLRPFIISFGTPEIFALTVLGACLVGVLSGGSVAKGALVAALGFGLATVGMDGKTGIVRFTFGELTLFDGIPLIPATVGLFAIPELIDTAVRRVTGRPRGDPGFSGVLRGSIEALRRWAMILRCSLIAIFIALIPGLGGGVSQWMAYAHAQQSSKEPENFGTGAIDGVIGPAAANNAKDGGQMIPLVAFGIPGGSISAILLGILLILGLNPGPEMLKEQADVTLFMVFALVAANVLGVIVAFPLLKRLSKVTYIKPTLVVPFITVLLVTAAVAERGLMADTLVMIAFGLVGWFMDRVRWSRPALLLGFVLAARSENSLWISYSLMGFEWLLRPGVLVLFGLAFALVLWMRLRARRDRRRLVESGQPVIQATRPAYSALEAVMAACTIAMAIVMFVLSRDWSTEARLFPEIVAVALGSLSAVRLLQLWWRRPPHLADVKRDMAAFDRRRVRYAIGMVAWICGFFLAVYILGFTVAVVGFVLAYLVLEKVVGMIPAVLCAAVSGFLFPYVFGTVFDLRLPVGILW